MLKDKYYYELTLLARPDLSEQEVKDFIEKIEAIASKENPLFKSDPVKKIRLAYPIKKQNEAFLACLGFQSEGTFAIEVKKQIEAMPEVLRFLIVKKKVVIEEPPKEPELKLEKVTEEAVEAEEEKPVKEKTSKKEEKSKEKEVKKKKETKKKTASMEEIEKDLEKILDLNSEDKL